MPAPADSLLKVNWAQYDFHILECVIGEFAKSDAYSVWIQPKSNGGNHSVMAKCSRCPSDWGLMVGDIAHNVRSALDYIVYRATGLPADSQERRKLCFPICDNSSLFQRAIDRGSLQHVGQPMIDFIESFQPYERGQSDDPLTILQLISNGDKHHALRTMSAIGHNAGVSMGGDFGSNRLPANFIRVVGSRNMTVDDVTIDVYPGEITEHEREIVSFSTPLGAKPDFKPHITPEVQFGKGQPGIEGRAVVPSIRLILDRVKEILRNVP